MRTFKDSTFEWIGLIPKEWDIKKGKYLFDITTGDLDVNAENPEGEYPFFTCSMFPKRIDKYAFDCEALLVAGNGLVGFTQYYKGKFNAYQRTYVLSNFREIDPQFLKFYTMNMLAKEVDPKKVGSVIQFIKLGDLQNFHVCLPSLEEQARIADFLHSKTQKIDFICGEISREIDELLQYKKSIIYETLKKGLLNKKTKNTCSDVWDYIPCDWQLIDIKYVFDILKRIAGREGFDVLSVTQTGLKVKDITSGDGQLAENYSGYQFVYPGDYVMNHMDLLTGWVDLSSQFGVTSPDYRVFRLKDMKNNNAVFFKYVMQCCYLNRIFYSLGQGVSTLGRWRLQTDSFNNFKIPLPPKKEQDLIADYLDSKISLIDKAINDKSEELNKFEELRASIIYEYVTGKKEVPNE